MMLLISAPVSCDQLSNALSTCCSASEVLLGRAFVLISPQRPRMTDSRRINCFPSLTFARSSLTCAERADHEWDNGTQMKLTPMYNATAAMVSASKNCWRFSIFIRTSACVMEIKRELHRRFAVDQVQFQTAHAVRRAQLRLHRQQGRAVAGRAGGTDRVVVMDLDGLGRHRAIFGKCQRQLPQDREVTERLVKPDRKSVV